MAINQSFEAVFDEIMSSEEMECRVCGCTDSCACEGGCYWVLPELCSQCAEKMLKMSRSELMAIFTEKYCEGKEFDSCKPCSYWSASRCRHPLHPDNILQKEAGNQ